VERRSVYVVVGDSESGAKTVVLLLVGRRQSVSFCHRRSLGGGGSRLLLLLQHHAETVHLLLDLLCRIPLLFHHVLQLSTLDLQLPLPLVLQDLGVGLPVELTLQPLAVLLVPLAAPLVPRPFDPQARQVALHVAIGAAAPRSRQADPIVHGSVFSPGTGRKRRQKSLTTEGFLLSIRRRN